ncbi:MAG: Bax inhibitor-1/YccA family protein [Flavobacteriales bacterium]|jgi:FtsH-binding integral membrane protein|nr:Bax inhibitor-1/YccA family protein [Flavobacteriales bacterium]
MLHNNFEQKEESESVFSEMMSDHVGERSVASSFVSNVFAMMTLALAISGAAAYWLIASEFYLNIGSIGIMVIQFAPLGLVLLMGFGYKKLSSLALTGVFIVYSVLMGLSIGMILLMYTASTVYVTFGITAATFLAMALLGYTTKSDLTKFGSLLYMALFGIIIAMIVNWFLGSEMLDYIISIVGVLVFTGLTAYDVQKIKELSYQVQDGAEDTKKMVVMGALNLYLDFVNLFLFLLRIFGGRD